MDNQSKRREIEEREKNLQEYLDEMERKAKLR